MKLLTIIGLAALVLAVGSPAVAETPPPASKAEMKAARAQMQKICAADIKTLCDGKVKLDLMMCMRANMSKASQPCQRAAAAMSKRAPKPAA